MEMKIFLISLILILTLASCANTPEIETGEIRTLQLLKQAFESSNKSKHFVDARTLLSRKQIDAAKTPVLFVELISGQNGTLTPYPGQGIGQTWLGADGATLTTDQGVLKASRGMGDDIMGSFSKMPKWSKIDYDMKIYSREISHLTGNNKINTRLFECKINKKRKKEVIEVWGLKFSVTKFTENCNNDGFEIENIYYVDNRNIVRKSFQYHSDTIGYITTERLDQ